MFYFQENRGRKRTFLKSASSQLPSAQNNPCACQRGRFLGGIIFLFRTLNISCHSLLACNISVEKSANNLRGKSFVISSFSLTVFRIISLTSDTLIISWCRSVWIFLIWDPLYCLFLNICFLP